LEENGHKHSPDVEEEEDKEDFVEPKVEEKRNPTLYIRNLNDKVKVDGNIVFNVKSCNIRSSFYSVFTGRSYKFKLETQIKCEAKLSSCSGRLSTRQKR